MSQLIFKYPFKTKYYEQDFYVSSNNFPAYKLIESWPKWPGKWLNIFGAHGSGKTHLSKILEKRIKKIIILDENKVNDTVISELNKNECLIIDDYKTWGGCKKAVDEYFKNKKNIFFKSIDNDALMGIKF